jgi:hypothetical protein
MGILYIYHKREDFMQCTHCGSAKFVKNGSYKGSQRFICSDCGSAFSDKVCKFTYADKERFLEMYLNNTGVRKAARFMGCFVVAYSPLDPRICGKCKKAAKNGTRYVGTGQSSRNIGISQLHSVESGKSQTQLIKRVNCSIRDNLARFI